ncbi:MAG: RNA polymerase sigma factor [Gemmataceae bacterium]
MAETPGHTSETSRPCSQNVTEDALSQTFPNPTPYSAPSHSYGRLYEDATDAALVGWYNHDGDENALTALLDRYEATLFPFLVGILKNYHQAEDALQETWYRALQNLEKIDIHHLRGWLFTVAYHQAMLIKRKQKIQERTDTTLDSASILADMVIDMGPGPSQQLQNKDDLEKAKALLDRLSPAQRQVICQRIFEGKRFREIAEAMDCPVNTALARMHEGLKRLRRLWGAEYVSTE